MEESRALGKKAQTQEFLRLRVNRAIRILESDYLEPPSANELANTVGISVSHFHKVFRAIVGETVTQHCLRLRIERAATLLRFSSWQVGEIGGICGFQTHASFSRGFKRLYKITPKEFRKQVFNLPFLKGVLRERSGLRLSKLKSEAPEVKTEVWNTSELICLRFYGSVNDVYKPWQTLLKWAQDASIDLTEARCFGLWFDSWEGLDDDNYRYECAISLPTPLDHELPKQFFIRRLEQGSVAITSTCGSIAQIDQAWYSFVTQWLPFSGFQPRGEFVMDEYPVEFLLASPIHNLMKILLGKIPVSLCILVQIEPVVIK